MAAQGAAAPRGACIVRTDVQHQLAPHAATLKASFNLRTAAIVPDLLVTCNGRTLPFVVALQGAENPDHLRQVLHRAETVVGTFRSCTVMLPSSCSMDQRVMDATASFASSRFIFMARGDDPVALAIELAERLHGVSQLEVEQLWLDDVCSWDAMLAALTSVTLDRSTGQVLSVPHAHALSILRSLRHVAAADVSTVLAASGLPLPVVQALDRFWASAIVHNEA